LQFNTLIDGIKKNQLKNVIPLKVAAWNGRAKLNLMVFSYR